MARSILRRTFNRVFRGSSWLASVSRYQKRFPTIFRAGKWRPTAERSWTSLFGMRTSTWCLVSARRHRNMQRLLCVEGLERRTLLASDIDLLAGTIVSQAVDAAGDTDRYHFTVDSATKAVFDSFTNNNNIRWSLRGPSGTLVDDRAFDSSDGINFSSNPTLTLLPGDYTLTVSASTSQTGPYSFRLLELAGATLITPDTVVGGTLDPANETDLYRFTVTAGDQFNFDSLTTAVNNARWRLLDPFGQQVFFNPLNTDSSQTLNIPGTYTLLVEGAVAATATTPYQFNVDFQSNTPPPGLTGDPLTLGTTVNGSLASAAEVDNYLFTLGADSKLAFDSLSNTNNIRWSLVGPTGTLVTNRSFTSSDANTLSNATLNLVAGQYQLSVSGTGAVPGNYSYRLLNHVAGSPYTPGTVQSGTLDPANESDIYRFSANAGDRFYFDTQTATPRNAYARLVDPYGQDVFLQSLNSDVGTQTLNSAGVYTLLIEGHPGDTGTTDYSFNLQPVSTAAPTALTIGSTTSGNITTAGDQDRYTFTLVAGARLVFDSLTNNSQIRWSLSGPPGEIVTNRGFTNSDGNAFGTTPALNLVSGNYTLTVFANTDNTGAYSFRLLDLGTATAFIPGTLQSGTLNPANETDLYRFTANAGDRFYFDWQTPVARNAYARLVDPFGQQVFIQHLGSDAGTHTLASTGVYTLLIEGHPVDDAGTTNYSFNVQPVSTAAPTALTIGSTTSGNIATAGEQDRYTFTLAAGARLVFDSLTNNSQIRWSLSGPPGEIVTNRGFPNSDSNAFGTTPALDLVPGNYTLTVFANTDNTGAYSFRLLDLATATAFTPGTLQSGTLDPANESDIYRFTANAGDRFYFDWQTPVARNAYARLVDPFGQQVFIQHLGSDAGTHTLASTGVYTLLIEGHPVDDTGTTNYSFNVQPVSTSPPTALTIGSTTSGNVATAGEQDVYTFTLGASARLVFDSLTNNSQIRWSLSGPPGEIVTNRGFANSDSNALSTTPALNLVAGAYTLTVFGTNDTTGAYSFRLLDLSSATLYTPGTLQNGTLNPANETDLYRFTVAAGDRFNFDSQTTTAQNAYWRLLDPFGQQVFIQHLGSDPAAQTLNVPGVYTMLFEGHPVDTGTTNYAFNVVFVSNTPPPALTGDPLTVGNPVSGSLATASEVDNYLFTLGADSKLYFDTLANNANIRWSLIGPTGTVVSNRVLTSSDWGNLSNATLNLIAGQYQLSVSGTAPGNYEFRLLDLASAAAYAPGTVQSGTLNPGNETDLYWFIANAGDSFYFDRQTTTTGNSYWRLVDPFGQDVFLTPHSNDVDTRTLVSTGTYTLMIEGSPANTTVVNYSFAVQPVLTNPPIAMTVGSTTSGDIAAAGEQDRYTFTLGANSQLYFDSFTNDSNLNWTLTGPSGTVIANRPFNTSDWGNRNNATMILPAGAYTLTVAASADNTGAYSFRLLDLATATSYTPGAVQSGTLTPGNETDMYRFTANAGDSFYFDEQTVTTLNSYWRLVDPFGQDVFLTPHSNDVDTRTLVSTGTYTLMIEGNPANTTTVNYSFAVQPVFINPLVAMTVGSTTSGNISTAGEQDRYTFTLAANSQLYFDTFTNDGLLNWSLTGPGGSVVAGRAFSVADWGNRPNATMNLPAGDYTLTVAGTADNIGPYSFRLLDLATATPYTPGAVQTGTLSPGNETDMYRFAANAGDKFYFDQQTTSTASSYWRLVDPFGQDVFLTPFSGDVATRTLNAAGTYTLMIEGIPSSSTALNYTFNVQPVDVRPTVTASDSSGNEASSVNLSVSFGDIDSSRHCAFIDWNDGSPIQVIDPVTSPFVVSHTYADNGVYNVSVIVEDEDGFQGTDTAQITILNVPPTAEAAGPYSVNEGATVALSGTGTDVAGVNDPLTFAWDLDGDGVFGETGAGATRGDEVGQTPTFNAAALDGPSTVTVTLRVNDGDGGITDDTATINVVNVAPTINTFVVPPIGSEGTAVNLTATASDPAAANDPLTFTWTITRPDTTTFTLTGANVSFTPADNGTYGVSLTVNDGDGGSDSDTATIAVANVAPTIDTFTVPATANEGAMVNVSATASDPAGASDPLTFSWTVTGPGGFSVARTGPTPAAFQVPDNGTYNVTLLVDDGDGGQATRVASFIVANVNPTAAFAGPASVAEGDTATVTFSGQIDVAADAASLRYSYDFDNDGTFEAGDGTYAGSGINASQIVPASFFADGPGARTVHGRILDKDGGFTDYTVTITINNVAPTVTAFNVPATANEGAAVNLNATASDPAGANDTPMFTWTITRPDTTTFVLTGSSASFTPADNGSYGVRLVVTDEDGGASAPSTATVAVANVNPTVTINGAPPGSINIGTPVNLTSTVTDPGSADTHSYLWHVVASNGQSIPDGTSSTFSFTPNNNGTYTVTLTATDDDGGSDNDTVTIVVSTVINLNPIAVDDPATVNEDSTNNAINVLINDSDPDGGTLSITAVTQGANGIAAFTPGSVSYTPNPNFVGTDTFTYTISDGQGGTDTATVTVTVVNADSDFVGTAGDDTYYVKLNATGTDVEIYANETGAGTPIFSAPLASLTTLMFDMLAGDDRLFVDLANGSPLPTGGIDLLGGANGATGDRLIVLGNNTATGSYAASATTTGDGVVMLNGRPIDLVGVEPIRVSDLTSFIVATPNPNDTLALSSPSPGLDQLAGTSGAVALSPVSFSDIDTFIIDAATNDAGAGNDSLSIASSGQAPSGAGFIEYRTGTGANTLDIQSGAARVDATVAAAGTLDTTVDDGASLFTHGFRQTSLSLGNGSLATVVPLTTSEVSVLDTLTIAGATDAWTGRLDLNTSDLIVRSSAADKAADFARLYNQLRQGFDGGTWLGNGITSLAAVTNPNFDTGLALVDNALLGSTTFTGQPVDSDSLLMKYTYYGDIDVNGQVDGHDLMVFANKFGTTSGATQVDGDIDFNGTVDGEDLTVFAFNFGKGIGAPLAASAPIPNGALLQPISLISHSQAMLGIAEGQPIDDDDLLDLLAESIATDRAADVLSTTDSRLAIGRKSACDSFWAEHEERTPQEA